MDASLLILKDFEDLKILGYDTSSGMDSPGGGQGVEKKKQDHSEVRRAKRIPTCPSKATSVRNDE